MANTVFWSWQSDFNPKTNRHFIRGALAKAVDLVSQGLEVENAERIELDHDTKSASGMADISNTILEQVSVAAIFVADVTPIATADSGKKLPNPNVMVELGFALHALGFERIIAILNIGDGHKIEELPFDIRHRRIMIYSLKADANKSERKCVGDQLAKDLTAAITGNIKNANEVRSQEEPIAGAGESKTFPGLWDAEWPTKHQSSFGDFGKVNPTTGARAYLRVIPDNWPNGLPQITQLEDLPDGAKLWASIGGGSAGSFGSCSWGYISYWFSNDSQQDVRTANNLAGFIEDSGEIWFSDGAVFNLRSGGGSFLLNAPLLSNWAGGLEKSHRILDQLGASKRRRVMVGISNFDGAIWLQQEGYVPTQSRKANFEADKTELVWERKQQVAFLHTAWNGLRNAFSLPAMNAENFEQYYTVRIGQ